MENCTHPLTLNSLCAICGVDTSLLPKFSKPSNEKHPISLRTDKLLLASESFNELYEKRRHELWAQRKLVLVVDLDQTILSTTAGKQDKTEVLSSKQTEIVKNENFQKPQTNENEESQKLLNQNDNLQETSNKNENSENFSKKQETSQILSNATLESSSLNKSSSSENPLSLNNFNNPNEQFLNTQNLREGKPSNAPKRLKRNVSVISTQKGVDYNNLAANPEKDAQTQKEYRKTHDEKFEHSQIDQDEKDREKVKNLNEIIPNVSTSKICQDDIKTITTNNTENEAKKDTEGNSAKKDELIVSYAINDFQFITKFRPGLLDFLETLSKHFTLYIYTAGAQIYVDKLYESLPELKKYFGDRVITRKEYSCACKYTYNSNTDLEQNFNPGYSNLDKKYNKTINYDFSTLEYNSNVIKREKCAECLNTKTISKSLTRLFGNNTDTVLVLDDRADVWGFSENVILVRPYYGENQDSELERLEELVMDVHRKYYKELDHSEVIDGEFEELSEKQSKNEMDSKSETQVDVLLDQEVLNIDTDEESRIVLSPDLIVKKSPNKKLEEYLDDSNLKKVITKLDELIDSKNTIQEMDTSAREKFSEENFNEKQFNGGNPTQLNQNDTLAILDTQIPSKNRSSLPSAPKILNNRGVLKSIVLNTPTPYLNAIIRMHGGTITEDESDFTIGDALKLIWGRAQCDEVSQRGLDRDTPTEITSEWEDELEKELENEIDDAISGDVENSQES